MHVRVGYRKARATNEEYCGFMLFGARTAKLATVRLDGWPHVAPVRFFLDGRGVKGKSILRDGRVSLTKSRHSTSRWWRGRPRSETPPDEFLVRVKVKKTVTAMDMAD